MSLREAHAASALFEPDRLRLARQAAGFRKGELARLVEITPAAVGQYENGVTRPSAAVLARLALVLKMPVDFFARDGRPVPDTDASEAFFRSLRRATVMERERALAKAALVWEVFRALERHVEFPPVQIPEDLALPPRGGLAAAEERAAHLRRLWKLGNGPVPSVVRLLEDRGVIVSRLDDDSRRVSAFSKWFQERPVVVLSSVMGDKARSRFDGAHELGHLVMHPDPEPGNPQLERQAQAFAAALLLPANAIAAELPARADWDRLMDLKLTWGVSMQALLYRARTLGVMSESAFRRAMSQVSSFGWRTGEPGDLGAPERPELLRRALDLAAQQGVSMETLQRDVRLPDAWLDEILDGQGRRAQLNA